jgi:hypothetical protein
MPPKKGKKVSDKVFNRAMIESNAARSVNAPPGDIDLADEPTGGAVVDHGEVTDRMDIDPVEEQGYEMSLEGSAVS